MHKVFCYFHLLPSSRRVSMWHICRVMQTPYCDADNTKSNIIQQHRTTFYIYWQYCQWLSMCIYFLFRHSQLRLYLKVHVLLSISVYVCFHESLISFPWRILYNGQLCKMLLCICTSVCLLLHVVSVCLQAVGLHSTVSKPRFMVPLIKKKTKFSSYVRKFR